MENEVVERAGQLVSAASIKKLRKSRRESQSQFWRRFGVTQSRGSRFERGLKLPVAVAILMKLYFDGKVSDGDLQHAGRMLRKRNPSVSLTRCVPRIPARARH